MFGLKLFRFSNDVKDKIIFEKQNIHLNQFHLDYLDSININRFLKSDLNFVSQNYFVYILQVD